MKNRSRLISVACMSACSMLYSAHSVLGAPATFNGVGVLDPNAATSANPNGNNFITITDAASNNQSNGVNFSQFNTLITTAFANNTGAVCNFGDNDGSGNPTIISGNAANTTIGNANAANAVTVNYGASLANQFAFYRSDSAATATVGIDYNTNQGTKLASGVNNGDYLGIQGASAFSLTFVNPLADFGITMLPRSDGANRTNTFTIHYSNGASATSSSESVGNSTAAIFYGFAAPTGLSITSIDSGNTGAIRLDDLAFVVAPAAVAGASVYWTNAAANGSWASNNWSNNANGTGAAVALPTNGSTGVTFTASTITSGTVATTLGATQNVSSIAVNTTASAVSIGGTNDLTVGLGGISLISATPLTINTSGKLNLGASQAWNSGTSTLTVASQVAGVAGAGITFLGTGTTTLSGPNTYTGLTAVQSGSLILGNATALGGPTATLQITNGAVDLKNFNTTLASISGTGGSITSSTTGLTTITIASTPSFPGGYFGNVQNGGGTVAINVASGGILSLQNLTVAQNYSGGTTVQGGGSLFVGAGSGNTGATAVPDYSLGTGPVTVGSAITPVAHLTLLTQGSAGNGVFHNLANVFSFTGNALITNAAGSNFFTSPVTFTGSNNAIQVALAAQSLNFAGGLNGSGSVTVTGYNHLIDPNGGGGFISIGNATTPVDNSGFTGTITAVNTVTTDNTRGAQIVALQNAVLPNGTFAFSGNVPVVAQGPTISGFNGSAISFAAGVTAPQIGALSSSTGGAIALGTQAGESVNLSLGLNNSTGSSYAGSLYDNGSGAPGSLTKVGTNQQILTGSNSYVGGTNVSGGNLTFAAPNALPNFTNLTIGANASAGAANFGTGPKNNLFASGLSIAGATNAWTGKLDLANNDMVVQNGVLATLTNQVVKGFNNGAWNGSGGIVSSAAASDTTHLHALGVIQNSVDGTTGGAELYSASTSNAFDGATADAATDVLIKYTYYGDANLDGKVDGSDYTRIDAGFLGDKAIAGSKTGWYNGDFNYDGTVNGSDYTLIDNAFNRQTGLIAAELATPTAEIAGGSSVPEPTSLGLLGIGVLSVLSRRKRMPRQ